jgi:virginiamycin B lyase
MRAVIAVMLVVLLTSAGGHEGPGRVGVVSGRVVDGAGAAVGGVFVGLRATGAAVTHTRVTDASGRFSFPPQPAGAYELRAHRADLTGAAVAVQLAEDGTAAQELRVAADAVAPADRPASHFLALLPAGEEKRRFILDCTGCHTFDDRILLPAGSARTHAGWAEAVARMLGFAGPASGFPVIAAGREPEATAAFLTAYTAGGAASLAPFRAPAVDAAAARALITEYDIPAPTDLPHDVAIDSAGEVIITGMFTHRMYVLDAATGGYETLPIPVEGANPRAVEVGADGSWWVLLGGPGQIARYDPRAQEWTTFPIGLYGHSLGPDGRGRVWFNGHFTKAPELMGYVDASTGEKHTFDVPPHPTMATTSGPIPYELRVAPDGGVWISELAGNRVVRFDPEQRTFAVHTMPEPHAGPRRLDIAPDGTVWIPEYAGNRITRLDPRTGEFRGWELPLADAAPYVARVDARTGIVWIGTGAADAIVAFDPRAERFTTYPLPTRGAMIRHIAIDPRNGDVWAAYGASPGIPAKVARLRPDVQ